MAYLLTFLIQLIVEHKFLNGQTLENTIVMLNDR